MEKQDIINILKQYNFLENSIRKFSLEYKITEKTIKKYLVENNIPYSKRTIKYEIPRDVNGRYKLNKVNDGRQSRPVDFWSNNQLNNQIKKPKVSIEEHSSTLNNQNFSIDNFMTIKKMENLLRILFKKCRIIIKNKYLNLQV